MPAFASAKMLRKNSVLLVGGLIAVAALTGQYPSALSREGASEAGALKASRWVQYRNTRYDVVIEYPADIFKMKPAPPDNAGRDFESPATNFRFSIYSHANALEMSIDEFVAMEAMDLGGDDAKTQKGPAWFEISVTKEGMRVLRRVLFSEEGSIVHRFEMAFPMHGERAVEPIVSRMMSSFRVHPSKHD